LASHRVLAEQLLWQQLAHVDLAARRVLDFTAPRYGGGLATELRFRMTLDDGTELHSSQ
jgi:hypothetical protein